MDQNVVGGQRQDAYKPISEEQISKQPSAVNMVQPKKGNHKLMYLILFLVLLIFGLLIYYKYTINSNPYASPVIQQQQNIVNQTNIPTVLTSPVPTQIAEETTDDVDVVDIDMDLQDLNQELQGL